MNKKNSLKEVSVICLLVDSRGTISKEIVQFCKIYTLIQQTVSRNSPSCVKRLDSNFVKPYMDKKPNGRPIYLQVVYNTP